MRRPGKIVQCEDGRLGRTYNDEPTVKGKIRVHLFPDSVVLAIEGGRRYGKTAAAEKAKALEQMSKDERRLCDPAKLKVIGCAD